MVHLTRGGVHNYIADSMTNQYNSTYVLYRRGFHAHTSQDTIQSSGAFKVPSYVLRATMMGQVRLYIKHLQNVFNNTR